MALKNWAYIFISPGFNPEQHTVELTSHDCRFRAIGVDVSEKEKVIALAKQLVADGVQMLELCGGFGPIWIAKVSEAIENKIPVGSVAYGPEARKPLLDILTSK